MRSHGCEQEEIKGLGQSELNTQVPPIKGFLRAKLPLLMSVGDKEQGGENPESDQLNGLSGK